QRDDAIAGVDVDVEPLHRLVGQQLRLDHRRERRIGHGGTGSAARAVDGLPGAVADAGATVRGIDTWTDARRRRGGIDPELVDDVTYAIGVACDHHRLLPCRLALDRAGQRHDAVVGVDVNLLRLHGIL